MESIEILSDLAQGDGGFDDDDQLKVRIIYICLFI